jgi:hypothetical protein
MAIILMNWGNKEEEICFLINIKSQHYFFFASKEETISQTNTHISVVISHSKLRFEDNLFLYLFFLFPYFN